MKKDPKAYYIPEPSSWPFIGCIALLFVMTGAANWLHGSKIAPYFFSLGLGVLVFMMFGWFGTVIREGQAGFFNRQVDHSYRWAMAWFIFSEVMFFSAFFGSLFYIRVIAMPWLSGAPGHELTHYLLWPDFSSAWPVLRNPDPALFTAPKSVMEAWGVPAINTLLLLSSGVTITFAHWGLLKNKRRQLIIGLAATILLGVTFLALQATEYTIAYLDKGLTLGSGIYGSTFFILTGFHGLHVTIGTLMLMVVLGRCIAGHFDDKHHFAFEAAAWYWHFVDVVWLLLFVFVYWL